MVYLWDLASFRENEKIRPQYKGHFKVEPMRRCIIRKDSLGEFNRRLIVGIPLMAIGAALISAVFIGVYYLTDYTQKRNVNDSLV